MAGAANKGLIVALHAMCFLGAAVLEGEEADLLLLAVGHLLVDLAPSIQAAPDAAELADGSEDGALDLVDEVVVLVGALDEVGVVGVDCQLRLADEHVLVPHVHEDVVGAFLQPVLDADYLEHLRVLLRDIRQVLEQLQDFLLLRADLAPHQVADLEADEVGRRGPSRPPDQLLIVHPLRHLQQSVDKSVEVKQDVRVQVIDDVDRKDAGCFLKLLHIVEVVPFE